MIRMCWRLSFGEKSVQRGAVFFEEQGVIPMHTQFQRPGRNYRRTQVAELCNGVDYVTQDLCIPSLADEEKDRRNFMGDLAKYELV